MPSGFPQLEYSPEVTFSSAPKRHLASFGGRTFPTELNYISRPLHEEYAVKTHPVLQLPSCSQDKSAATVLLQTWKDHTHCCAS